MAESPGFTVDRRGLLAGAGALALATALPGPPAGARPAAGLAAARAATARRLARALRAAGDPALRHVGATAAAWRLDAWLATQPDATRAQADAVLDLLGADGLPSAARLASPAPATDHDEARRTAALTAAAALLHTALGTGAEAPEPLALA